tara:strand:+ start:827 stop:1714 length:888 start_codon:yes stop_codon:yes gene_type:complete
VKYTNKHNVPSEIIRALNNDSYSKGDSVISVTGLLQPPQIRLLNKKHYEDITIDVSDEIWKLLGQSVHTILERANEDNEDTITEQRMYAGIKGWRISGQTDSISVSEGILKDYKVTSAWSVVSALTDGKPEWEQQLNCYAWLNRMNSGQEIKALQVIAIARDWSKFQHQRSSGNYPISPVAVVNIPMWDKDKQESFIEERVALHQQAEADHVINDILPKCSDIETWKKEDTYRIIKKGRKSAVRVLHSQEEADEYLEKQKDTKGLSIEIAKGVSTRCESYCSVSEFCKQFNKEEL